MLVGLKDFYVAATGIAPKNYATHVAVAALRRWKIPMVETPNAHTTTRKVDVSFHEAARVSYVAENTPKPPKPARKANGPAKPHGLSEFNNYRVAAAATMERIEAKLDRLLSLWEPRR